MEEDTAVQGKGRPGVASRALRGALGLLVAQVLCRLVSFGLNLVAARRLGPGAFGVGAVQFHLLTTTILFLSREGFRRGCTRLGDPQWEKHYPGSGVPGRVLGTSWPVVPIGLLVSTTFAAGTLAWTRASLSSPFGCAVVVHAVAAVVELLSEPLYILAQAEARFAPRAAADVAAQLLRGLVLLWQLQRGAAPETAFAASQAAAAGTILVILLLATWRELGSLVAAGKHVLAEGEKIVLVTLTTAQQQGEYGLASGLGALAVRTLLQPLEEAAFATFSSGGGGSGDGGKDAGGGGEGEESGGELAESAATLAGLMRAAIALGLLAVVFGPPYADVVVRLLYADKWADSGVASVLSVYCLYVLALALNGTTEAFLHARAPVDILRHSNKFLLAVSVCHLGAAAALAWTQGPVGVVVAGALSMAVRTTYSCAFIRSHFRGRKGVLASMVPRWGTLAAFAAAAAATRVSAAALRRGGLMQVVAIVPPWARGIAEVALGRVTPVSLELFEKWLPRLAANYWAGDPREVPAVAAHLCVGAACGLLVGAVVAVHEGRGVISAARRRR
ncbi:unnamed protein product [Pedinophyceae sp. YPF-701]|nr:unnamed protein product [Pedinophyceae sp. YPF-701]